MGERTRTRRTTGAASLLAVLALVVTALSVTALSVATTAPAMAKDVRVRHTLFGAEDASADSASLTRIKEGSVRIWGVGARWDEIETRRHHYDWTRLDSLVAAAEDAHAEITMTVAMTPRFYAAKPTDPPKSVAPYRRFVAALMKRYPGISSYQVWNEANISTFWTGSTSKLAKLTRALARTRDRLAPHAQVIGPAMVTRLKYELRGIASFYRFRLEGTPVWRYVDAVSLHLYPLPRYGHRAGVPEDSMGLLAAARKQLRTAGVPASMPIWNTEINYGVNVGRLSGTPAIPISDAAQASNVMRTYLLNAAAGVKRVFWYRYDMGRNSAGGTIGNTLLSVPRLPTEMTPAGRAYLLVQRWMHGTLVGSKGHRPCARDRHGTYTCVVRDSSGTRRIYWNPFHRAKVRLAGNGHQQQGVLGAVRDVTPHSTLRVGPRPVMVGR